MTKSFCLCAAIVTIACSSLLSAASQLDRRLEQIFGPKPQFEAKRFGPAKWIEDGAAYTLLEVRKEKAQGKDLVRYDTATGRREVLIAAERFTPSGAEAKPLAIEDYAWSKDGRWLLIFANAQKVWRQKTRGDYWVLEVARGGLRRLGGKAPAASLMFAKFSPDGTRAAYVHEHNLYVEDVRSGAIRQVTKDGGKTVINGMGDWVNEEELDIRDGYRWSDDSRSLAYWQFDLSGVGEFTLLDTTRGPYPVLKQFAYPKVGTRNSAVRIGVVAASGGRTRWVQLPGDPREHYVARLEWAKGAGQLVVHQLNRLQNTL
ncbi:MAG: S9 family peptidase, partial [Verrucomicrobia bacterium]|nr:S9 family peptidase [Verrucomicrobiota bacterium]